MYFLDDVKFGEMKHQKRFTAFVVTKFDRTHCARRKTKLNVIKDRSYIVAIPRSAERRSCARFTYIVARAPAIINQAYLPKLATTLLGRSRRLISPISITAY